MNKRRLVVLAVLVLLAMAASSAAAENYRFITPSSGPELDFWNQLMESYNEQVGLNTWEFQNVPGGWDGYTRKFLAELAAQDTHDMSRMAIIQRPAFVANGYIMDMMPYAEQYNFDFSQYYETAFEGWRVDDKLYGVPSGIYTMAVYYNKDMFDEAGLEYPPLDWENAWTWEEWREAAAKLTSGRGPSRKYGAVTAFDLRWLIQFVWQNGGDYLNADRTECILDQPEAVEAFKFLEEMMFVDNSFPSPTQLSGQSPDELFRTGRVGMLIQGAWAMPAMGTITDFRWGVAPMPRGKETATGLFVDAYVIPTGAKDPEGSWDLIHFIASEPGQNLQVDWNALGIPINRKVAEERMYELFSSISREEAQVWLDSVDNGRQFPWTATWDKQAEVIQPIMDLWGLGDIDAEEMVKRIKDAVDPLL